LLLQFVAQLTAGIFLHLDLAAALGCDQLGKLLDPRAGRMVGVVQVTEPDRPFLNVLCQRHTAGNKQREHGGQFDQTRFHGVSSSN